MVALFDTCHPFPDFLDNARSFVAEHNGKRERQLPLNHMPIAMAKARRFHFHFDFPALGACQIQFFD